MTKIKVTADNVLSIILGIFEDEDANVVIDDPTAPKDWQGKTVKEVLNVEYYTFRHRPISSEQIIAEKIKQGAQEVNTLLGLTRSFCLVSLSNTERLFSKDVDMAILSASMEYWLQTSKVKILENLLEDCNIALNGRRIPVTFGEETRQAIIIFDRPSVSDIQTGTPYGEMAVVDVGINILLYPDVVSYSDYTVAFSFVDGSGAQVDSGPIPLSSLSYVNTMTQKAVPYVEAPRNVGNINLSRAISFVLVFDGYNNPFINYLADKALKGTEDGDNNQIYLMTLTRKRVAYTHEVVIKDHQATVNADTGNETHTLSLVTRGV